VVQTEKTVGVIFTFSDGIPVSYLMIPKDWVQKITPLNVKEEKEP
jgi:hypothetical protein